MRFANSLLAPVLGGALALASPVTAQSDDPAPDDAAAAEPGADVFGEAMAALTGLFAAEPLTPEQEARLPLATGIIAKIIPPGTLSDMMGAMFDKFIDPLEGLTRQSPSARVAENIGASEYGLELTGEQAQEIADMFDPAWEERKAREKALLPELMGQMMTAMEPPMRRAMAELYAINFTTAELTDIDAFFETESGRTYARKSFTMASDPRILAVSMEAMPEMFGMFAEMEQKAKDATADLPAARGYAELTDAERARITALTGRTQEEIEDSLATASDWEAVTDDAGEANGDAAETGD